jgi:peroxin-16
VYSALSLVSLYHDSIISRRLKQVNRLPESPFRKTDTPATTTPFPEDPLAEPPIPLGQSLPLPSDHTRYTSHFTQTSGVYATAGRALVILGYVQLLLEMVVVRGRRSEGAAQREGGRWRRWRVLVWLEAVK